MDHISRHTVGPSPSGRGYHAMASDGTRVFVFGGVLPSSVPVDEAKPIHVLDTSICFIFGWPPRSKTPSSSIPRNPTPTVSILVRAPPNLRGNHPRVLCPRDNHKSGQPLRRTPTRHIVLPPFNELPPKNWTTPLFVDYSQGKPQFKWPTITTLGCE